MESSLNVTLEGSPLDPIEVCIYLKGPLANIPSKGNSLIPLFKQKRLINHPSVKAYNQEFITRHTMAWVKLGIPQPDFGKNLVTVSIGLAQKPGRWDSHNANKLLADTLCQCGLYDDDSQAECHPYKKSEYQVFRTDLDTTTIIISRRRAYPYVSI